MTVRNDHQPGETQPRRASMPDPATVTYSKKPFVEPAISSPVDVLEATTFFQTVDSGGTGARRKP